jgi:hypothetical protein
MSPYNFRLSARLHYSAPNKYASSASSATSASPAVSNEPTLLRHIRYIRLTCRLKRTHTPPPHHRLRNVSTRSAARHRGTTQRLSSRGVRFQRTSAPAGPVWVQARGWTFPTATAPQLARRRRRWQRCARSSQCCSGTGPHTVTLNLKPYPLTIHTEPPKPLTLNYKP